MGFVDNKKTVEHCQPCVLYDNDSLYSPNARHKAKAERLVTLHVRDLVHGFRAVISTTPQWISGLNSRSEGTGEE